MRDQVRHYVEAGMGVLSPAKARELARSLTSGEGKERISRAAQDLMEWSVRSRDRLAEVVQREVRRQLKAVGAVTRDDLDALRKRVRDLEKARGTITSSPAAKPAARKASTGKPTTAKSPSRKTAPRTSTSRRSTSRSGSATTPR